MKSTHYHSTVFLIILLTAFSCSGTRKAEPIKTTHRPNIILIMADDLGYGDIGCYGNPDARTPNLDSLAARGLRFTDYHSNGANCSPTRAALMTGRYQQRAGLEGVIYVSGETRQTGLDTEQVTVAEELKKLGYTTGIMGKWHLGYRKEYFPVNQGFDEFRGFVSGNIDYHSHYDNSTRYDWWNGVDSVREEGYATDLITRHSLEFIERHRDTSFFLYVAHAAPHWPYQDREDAADRLPGRSHDPRGSRTDRETAYREMVRVMDEGIGQILKTLEELDLDEKTLVFFCSDNGGVPELGNNGPLRAHKGTLWEGGHRVPAIASWKGVIDAGESHQTVIGMDLLPTLVSLAGGIPWNPPYPDGLDLSAHLLTGQDLTDRLLIWRYREQAAARRGPFKLMVNGTDTLLFNLDTDLAETTNIIESEDVIARDLISALATWEAEMDSTYTQRTN